LPQHIWSRLMLFYFDTIVSACQMKTSRAVLSFAMLAVCSLGASAQEIHFSPDEDLGALDAALIGQAKHSIDFASYALTEGVILQALNNADRRGVTVRIVLDPREHHDFAKLVDLSDNVRIKRFGPLMHLKAYAIDGELLRTGSANFSSSGERHQDNDLIVIRDATAAAKFDAHFQRMWNAAQPMIEFEPAIKALEPK
jgi:phosphatidylserine/phosphatidylglycerophosphate/cardiolipin synthase-like enzyme